MNYTITKEQRKELLKANDRIGAWLSAALDDDGPCKEMKDDIEKWFEATTLLQSLEEQSGEPVAWLHKGHWDNGNSWVKLEFNSNPTRNVGWEGEVKDAEAMTPLYLHPPAPSWELLTEVYNNAYNAGHNDTVEGCSVHVLPVDLSTYHRDVVEELVADSDYANPPSPVELSDDEILTIANKSIGGLFDEEVITLARAIEKAHGITD